MALPTLHLICNAHLDPVWQWRWEEGCAEALSTFRTAVGMLRDHPDLLFNHNEAVLYDWVRKYDPPLFREIQDLVRAGRWVISGGWYIQPDVNLPGVESLLRHIIEGRKFFREYFNAHPVVAYNFDSFGHSGGLPQILRLAGFQMYVHMRPQEHEMHLPSDLYRWRGVDHTEIPAYRIAVGLYHTERDNIERRMNEGTALALKMNRDVPVFWGIGNHGGGATREDCAVIDRFIRTEKRVRVVHSTPDRLWEALREDASTAPVVEGDLQRAFTGCYTSLSRIKRRQQESLCQLVQTEALCSVTWWLQGAAFPEGEFTEAWRDHLFNDFHDILPGSCTQPAEQDALDQYGKVAETVRRLRFGAAACLNSGETRTAYIPVTVMNANPGLTRVPVEVECMLDLRPRWTGRWHLRLFTPDGKEVPSQEEQPESLLPFNGWRRKVSFMADLPAVGLENFELRIFEGESSGAGHAPALRHAIDQSAGLPRSLMTEEGVELLSGPLFQPLVVEDDGDSWGSDRWAYRTVVGEFRLQSPPVVVRTGPIRTVTESVMGWNSSQIVLHTIAYPDWPVLEFRFRVIWNEIRKRLKLSIPTVFPAPIATCEIPGGAIRRPGDGQEHVHGRWIRLEGVAGRTPVALGVVSGGLHGFDLQNGEARLSVLRSAAYCHEQGFVLGEEFSRKHMDLGLHEFRIAVTAGKPESVGAMLPALADWLLAPPVAYAHLPMGTRDAPAVPAGRNLLSVSPQNVRLTAFKPSGDGEGLIVRLQESTGLKSAGRVVLAAPAVSAEMGFHPFQIRTIRFDREGGWKEVDPVTEE